MIITTLSRKFFLLCLFMLSLTGFAQTNFTVSLANGTNPTTTTFEVDVMLTVVAPAQGVRLASVAFGVNYAPEILNGGLPCTTANCGSWAYIAGSKSPALNALLPSTLTNRALPVGHLRATMTNLSGANGIDILPGTYRIGSYRFTNTVPFTTSSNANLWLQPTNASGSTNTIVSWFPFGLQTPLAAYTTINPVGGAGLTLTHTSAATFSLPLNGAPPEICATSGTVVTVPVTCLGANNGSATITMNPVPTNLNVTYLRDNSVSGSATLNASGQFTITGLIAGNHIITVTSASAFCTTPVNIVTGFNVGAGTDPGPAPTVACYQTATLNSTTCTWVVTGTQPTAPTVACYETATFNNTTCQWVVTGTQPAPPTLLCYQTLGTFNNTTCQWNVSGTQPTAPTVACYETATFNNSTCAWVVTGTQPAPPTLLCYQTLGTFNNTTCQWNVSGTQPTAPTVACYETATFNNTTCQWVVTGTQPVQPTTACYQTATFNNTTCAWVLTGTQPVQPTTACYQTATFNNTTCAWVLTGTQPVQPTTACYQTATFNNTTCAWVLTGTQPVQPTTACYQTATFNNTTCAWVLTGTQPVQPTTACYQTATFNNTTCAWVVTGTQPAPPTLLCYQTLGTFNNTTCQWNVSGTQPAPPTLLCYQTLGTFNNATCQWNVLGTQPAPPTLLCYQTLGTFNNTTCQWNVLGTQPAPPTLLCYQTLGTFNNTTCQWNVSGTQPTPPTLLCYQTATFNNTTCVWVVTGTQPTLGSVTTTAVGSYTWQLPYGTGFTYTTNQVNLQNLVGCNLATLNLTFTTTVPTVNTFTVGASCGATISGLNVTINTPVVTGTTLYRFRLTNMVTNVVQVIDRTVNSFALSNYPGITLGTQYQIEVAIVVGVIPGPYGTPCIVFTPSPTATIGSQCGTTLTSMGQYIYSTYVPSATGYRFRVTNLTTSQSVILDSGLNRFAMTDGLLMIIRAFATVYTVEVALRNTDGTYLPYSLGCNITTPAFPTTTITAAQCGNHQAVSNTESFVAIYNASATRYRFRLSSTSPVSSATIVRLPNTFTLSMFPALPAGTMSTIEVSLEIGGVFGPYGSACTIITPVAPKTIQVVSNEFKAIAFPNPFAEDFMFNVKTSSESTIQIRVYDMIGKQIDNRNVEVSDIENLQIGSNYPSGVYNVIVSQGEDTQTLRVIKR